MSEELYNSSDYCSLAEQYEELKKENAELTADKIHLMNLFMESSEYVFSVVSNMKINDLERKCKALEADYIISNREMLIMQVELGRLRTELDRRDEELALTEKKLCNIDRSARAEIARRDELIKHKEEVIEHIEEKKKTVFERLSNTIKRRNKKIAEQADTIRKLKEDAERLIVYAVMFAHGNEDYRCTMCGNLVDKGEEHKSDCPITLHRALMKELEC